ncbi:MAG: hypothetical protein H7039_23585 [Bryobacteraceae bacterium]|nr:hypothetical protein [Bryobacteraceae bacterium]
MLVLLLSFSTLIAQTTVSGPKVWDMDYASARVAAVLDIAVSNAKAEYSKSSAFESDVVSVDAGRSAQAPWSVSATLTQLDPASTYYVRFKLNGSVTTTAASFETAPLPAKGIADPIAPRDLPNLAVPSIPAGNRFDILPDCSNAQKVFTGLASASLVSGSDNWEVVIPEGTLCAGSFVLPARPSHTGKILIRSAGALADGFPSPGTRLALDGAASLAAFETDYVTIFSPHSGLDFAWTTSPCPYQDALVELPASVPGDVFKLVQCNTKQRQYSGTNAVTAIEIAGNSRINLVAPGHGLQVGDLIRLSQGNGVIKRDCWQFVLATGDGTFQAGPTNGCLETGTFAGAATFDVSADWRQVQPVSAGPAAPSGACTTREWYHQTDGSDNAWWCHESLGWQLYHFEGQFGNKGPSVTVNGDNYHFVGITFTRKPIPEMYPGWKVVAVDGTHNAGMTDRLVTVNRQTGIVFDRCHFKGLPYPQKMKYAITGLSIREGGIVNSRFSDLVFWRASGTNQVEGANGVYLTMQNFIFENNYVEGAGIHFFSTEAATRYKTTDVRIAGNNFHVPRTYQEGAPGNSGARYPNRNSFECKQCERVEILNNTFENSYGSNVHRGTFVVLTTRCVSRPPSVAMTSFGEDTVILPDSHTFGQGDLVYISGTNTPADGLHEVRSSSGRQVKLVTAFEGGGISSGVMNLVAPGYGITDVRVHGNRFLSGTEIARILSQDAGGSCTWTRPLLAKRIAFTGNNSSDLNLRSFSLGGYRDSSNDTAAFFGSRVLYVLDRVQDVQMIGNSWLGNRGELPRLLDLGDTILVPGSSGLRVENNVFTYDEEAAGFRAVNNGASTGTAALNNAFRNWTFQGNVICCGLSSFAQKYPPGNLWPDTL